MKIFLDPGHNYAGGDKGAVGNGLKEQDVTFNIANALAPLLEGYGHEVKMSRNALTDSIGNTVTTSILERAKMANDWGAELFVSIHCNAYNGIARGTETLVYGMNSLSVPVAKRVQAAIVKTLGTADRGVKARPDLGVLWRTNMPALLVETAFIDNASDATMLRNRTADFAQAICDGVVGEVKETEKAEQTVMRLPAEVYVQEINPADFKIVECDREKREIPLRRYFNCGFFTTEKGGKTIPVGNLVCDGKVISQAKDNADWINLAGHQLTTVYTVNDSCGITKTDNVSNFGCDNAISGIPIIVGGKQVTMDEIKAEGYFGNELYNTWHGFLGIRHNKLVYVAMKCEFAQMCWALVALGIYDAIKLDGGGSFVLHDVKELAGTGENRRIHNVGVWT